MSEAVKGRAWDGNRGYFHRNLAVVIGIDLYQNDSIKDLSTAVSDARAIAHLLEQEYDYKQSDEKPEVIRLFDKDATLEALQHLFHTRIPQELNPRERDRLIIYYAGHGLPRSNDDGPEGYLVPHNADPTKPELFLAMRDVSEALSKLKCHHLLVILDCCFAGTFRWAGSRKAVPILETIRREHYYHFIRHPAWQVITSSAHDQEALDVARLKEDNRKPVPGLSEPHSPFALAILEGLQTGNDSQRVNADLYPDGVVTAHELFVYLQNRVKELSGERQNPGIFPLRQEYDKGEFIFTRPEFDPQNLAEALPLNEDNNPYRGLNSFDEKHARFFFGRQALIEELAKRLAQPNQALMVVLGVSGSGKSSLVKAGLIPYLRDQHLVQICLLELLIQFPPSPLKLRLMSQIYQWCILDPMRPGESPFMSLARTLLPIANDNLLERLAEVSFLDDIFQPMLKSEDESGRDSDKTAVGEQEGNPPATQPSLQADETLIKVADSWCSATPEAKLLLIEDYFAQLETLGNPQQKAQLKDLYDRILAELDVVSQQLQQEPYEYFSRAIATWSQKHSGVRLFLVIDQFEELLTRSQDDRKSSNQTQEQEGESTEQKEWQEFLEVLRIAIADHPQTLRLLLTLRSDFEPRFLTSTLEPHWKDARFPVRAMTSDELRQAIENPALKQALYFEELKDEKGNTIGNLVSKLVDEVGQMPGALPLLSFTLSELYVSLYRRWQVDRSTDRTLRFADYDALGGVAGALTLRATKEYARLLQDKDPSNDYRGGFGVEEGRAYQATMQRVMLRMVAIEGGLVVRRRVPESELVYPSDKENERVKQVSDRLVYARLLVKGRETEEAYLEPAHDFLVRGWDKLQEWIKQEQDNLGLKERLTPATREWVHEQKGKFLWNANPHLDLLKELLKLQNKDKNWLNSLETEFIKRSLRKRNKNAVIRWNIAIGVILGLSGLSVFSYIQQRATQRQNISTLIEASNAQVLAQQQLEAMVSAIQAAKQAQMLGQSDVLSQSLSALQNAFYKTQEITRLQGHQARIYKVVFNPDGKQLVTAAVDGTVRLWDISGKQLSMQFRGFEGNSSNIVLSRDGQRLASVDYDSQTLRVWDTSGRELAKVHGNFSEENVAFSPDGKLLAALNSGIIWLLDINSGKVHQFSAQGSSACFSGLMFSPNNRLLVTCEMRSGIEIIQIWNISGEKLTQFSGHQGSISDVIFSPDGELVATSGEDSIVRLWNLSGEKIRELKGHRGWVTKIAFSPHSQLLASAGEDGTIRLWNILGKELTQVQSSIVDNLEFSPTGKLLATTGRNGTSTIWQIPSSNELKQQDQGYSHQRLREVANPKGYFLSFGSNDALLATGSEDGTAYIWDISSKQIVQFDAKIETAKFSPNGKALAILEEDGTVQLWDFVSRELDSLPGKGRYDTSSLIFSSDGKFLATCGENGSIYMWNLYNKRLYQYPTLHSNCLRIEGFSFAHKLLIAQVAGEHNEGEGNIQVLDTEVGKLIQLGEEYQNAAFNYDGKILALELDKLVVLRDTSGKQIAQLQGGFSYDAIRSSTSRYIATVGSDNIVFLWDFSGNKVAQLEADKVTHIVFSPDENLLATSGEDGIVLLWDITGRKVAQLTDKDLPQVREGASNAYNVMFSPDGKSILTSFPSRSVRVWNTSGREITRFSGQGYWYNIIFSPDSFLIATDDESSGYLWSLSGQEIVRFKEHRGDLGSELIFSPDGQLLATLGIDGTLRLWQIGGVEELLEKSCNWVNNFLNYSSNMTKNRHLCD